MSKKEIAVEVANVIAAFKAGSKEVKATLKKVFPAAFTPETPFFAIGKKSGCLYIILDGTKKIRLNDGAGVWTKFKDKIGAVSEGYDINDYGIVSKMSLTIDAE